MAYLNDFSIMIPDRPHAETERHIFYRVRRYILTDLRHFR